MKKALVGYTGFVGSNIFTQTNFENSYNTKNITEAFGTNPDLLVYAGLPSGKFLANSTPNKDLTICKNAFLNIRKINPKKLVLISTVDVYKTPYNVDEDTDIDIVDLHPYGYNRYMLEIWVRELLPDTLIVRLPGLFGENLKKNFIFDLKNEIPSMLTTEMFNNLSNKERFLKKYYVLQSNSFYKYTSKSLKEDEFVRSLFDNLGFSAINFTDSRAIFQFYNLKYLWNHIKLALNSNILLLNLATEPISAGTIYEIVKSKPFINEISDEIPNYNFKTKHYDIFNGANSYILNKQLILSDIVSFINN